MKLRTINIALSPNNTWRDTLEAYWQLVLPWNWLHWKRGAAVGKLENKLARKLGVSKTYTIGSGREALYLILKSLNLDKGDEVILQSFTCMVVVNSINWNDLKPVYVDSDDTFNLDAEKLEAKINSKTRVVIIQHTFGIPAEVEKIKKICHKHGVILIEDCAHALGAMVDGKQVGTMGDFGFYSFGRSKVISAVSGGAIIVNTEKYRDSLEKEYAKLKDAKNFLIFQNLLHPIICSKAKLFYSVGLGKVIMVLSQKLKLLSFEVTKAEKKGVEVQPYPTRMPNALAKLAIIQLGWLDKFNARRRELAEFYFQRLHTRKDLKMPDPKKFPGAIFLRYPILSKNSGQIIKSAKKENIILGDWYNVPIAPADIDKHKSGYREGENANTEMLCKEVFNLPTQQNISDDDALRIVNFLNKNV